MNYPSVIQAVFDILFPYNKIDLLSKIASLQLCPENADHVFRLEALSYAAACLPWDPKKPIISRRKLEKLCNQPPLGDDSIVREEDPTQNAFTETVSFFGGSYIVFPGQLSKPTFILKHLMRAIFFGNSFEEHLYFRNFIYPSIQSVLLLSDIMAKKANLKRNMAPISQSKIVVPLDIESRKLEALFSCLELEPILHKFHLDFPALDPFILPESSLNPETFSPDNTPLHIHPIVKLDDQLIITQPGTLLASLNHHVLNTAKEFGLLDQLAKEYRDAVTLSVFDSLNRFDHHRLNFNFPEIDSTLYLIESLWSLDTDKVMYVGVRTDPLKDYQGNEVFGENEEPPDVSLLENHLERIKNHISQHLHGVNEIFFVIVHSGLGRTLYFDHSIDKLLLMLSASELEDLSLLYHGEQLVLYKFAKAQRSIHKTTKVISWSTLCEFENYRKNNHSFYLTDDHRPDLMVFSCGDERFPHLEVLEKFDIHTVPYLDTNGYIEVINVHQTPACPIFTELHVPKNQFNFYVEIAPVSFWITTKIDNPLKENNNTSSHAGMFVDFISYWLWQFQDDIALCFNEIQVADPIVIEIILNKTQPSDQMFTEEPTDENLSTCQIKSDRRIAITFNSPVYDLLNAPTNSGEIHCMCILLNDLCTFFRKIGWEKTANRLQRFLPEIQKKYGGHPTQKKIIVLDPSIHPQLLPGNPIGFRKVQDADQEMLLDDLAQFLGTELHLTIGPIPKEQHSAILNSIVTYYFQELTQIVRDLDPKHTLYFLVTHYEAVVYERAYLRLTLPTQQACFGEYAESTKHISQHIRDIDEAAVSCRFLIELVAATPPQGNQPISFTTYDRMMALASEIIARGDQSDMARYGLFDFQFEILASGRLGFNRSDHHDRYDAFQKLRAQEEVEYASRTFPSRWKERIPVDPDHMSPDQQEINSVFESEFGISLLDISRFVSELGNISIDMDDGHQMKSMEFRLLVKELAIVTGWTEDKVIRIIDFLSLKTRPNFMEPPTPYRKTDVYPWRMSRGLSYLRRPLVIVEINKQSVVCWGVRHLFSAFEYLLNATLSGRLQDYYKSLEMQQYLGRIHTEEGKKFNQHVCSLFKQIPEAVVEQQVKKIGSNRVGDLQDLGDIDVLAILTRHKTIFVVECKALEIARNSVEMSWEAEELFNTAKPGSTASKHLMRTAWIQKNLGSVLSQFTIPQRGKWSVKALLITSESMITPQFYSPAFQVMSINQFCNEFLPRYAAEK